jgi:uncharacterized FlaG/YvyC family protein
MRLEPISENGGSAAHIASVVQISRIRPAGDSHAQGAPPQAAAVRRGHAEPDSPDAVDARTAAELGKLAEALRENNIRLEFTRNDTTGMVVLKLVDQATGETLQQIPSVVSQHLAEVFGKLQGQVFNKQA